MPTHFWNAGEKHLSGGLDILGYRRVDQDFEKPWVSGITTISQRARYLTVLPWILREYYGVCTREPSSPVAADWKEFQAIERRLEFIMLAATKATDAALGRVTGGILGSEVYAEELRTLQERGSIAIAHGTNTALFGTYVAPARSFGLLAADGMAGPWEAPKISPRGERLHAIRSATLRSSRLVEAILSDSPIEAAAIQAEAEHFSLGVLDQAAATEERDVLEEAMLVPLEGQSKEQYARFRRTLCFALRCCQRGIARSDHALADNLRQVISAAREADRTSVQWAIYELLRRVHFALELLLDALTEELKARDGATVEAIVADLAAADENAPIVDEALMGGHSLSWSETVRALIARLQPGLGSARPLRRWSNLPSARDKCSIAAMLLVDAWQSTALLRSVSDVRVRRSGVDGVFPILASHADAPLHTLLVSLLKSCVVEPHLATTLRKMGNGLKCSLRFYPEGPGLRATGTGVSAGFSGDRLSNVFGFAIDLGLTDQVDDEARLSVRGRRLLDRLEAENTDA